MKFPEPEGLPSNRARWLGDLAAAIDEAQDLAWRLGYVEGDSAEARELYRRLEEARRELDSLQRGGWGRLPYEFSRIWTGLSSSGSGGPGDDD